MIDDRELISGLNSAIERLLRGDPAVAVEEDVDIEVRPYVEIFALLLEDVRDGARPEFRASLRERFVGGLEVPGRRVGSLGRVAGFAAATFILGSAVNPVLARSLMASISDTMGDEIAGAVGRILDLDPADEIASPDQLSPASPAAGSTAQLPISPEIPANLFPPLDGATVAETPELPALPPGVTGQHPVQHPAPAAVGNAPAPPASASTPPPAAGARPANTPTAGSAPVIDPPVTGPPVETPASGGDAPTTSPTAATTPADSPTTTPDPTPTDPTSPGNGKGNPNDLANGPNGGNGNPGGNASNGNPGNSGPQQGGPAGAKPSKRADAVQAAGSAGAGIKPLPTTEHAAAAEAGGQSTANEPPYDQGAHR